MATDKIAGLDGWGGMEWWRRDRWPGFAARLERARDEVACSDARTRAHRVARLRELARSGANVSLFAPEVFALLASGWNESAGLMPHPVQFQAGWALCGRTIVEMATGEGKSLAATFPLAVHGLRGAGAWLVTANDYLARRDAESARPVFAQLGLSVGCVLAEQTPEERRTAYACDVTYGTAREFGFDFLRDRLKLLERGVSDEAAEALYAAEPELRLQRKPGHVVIDEADHILIDEARTPLILSGPAHDDSRGRSAAYCWAARHATSFQLGHDFIPADPRTGRGAWLTAAGRERVRQLPMPRDLKSLRLPEMYEFLERAIRVSREYARDREYIVDEGRIVIVDEGTGRPSPGRQWAEGLHQAVEAREGVEVSPETETLARVTVQEFFGRFRSLSGTTGTARSSATELRRVYRLRMEPVPTHVPARRLVVPPRVFSTAEAKWAAVVSEIRAAHVTGRPVLVGTRRIDDSHRLSELLKACDIPHRVLNATQMSDEARIVGEAGQLGRVTIATNMAGRGTDIRLGAGTPELGGLLVIGTELHESERIDRQLAGRCARQGDPGEVRSLMAISDEILRSAWGERVYQRLSHRAERQAHSASGELLPPEPWSRLLHRAQRVVEKRHALERVRLLERDKLRRDAARNLGRSVYAE